MHVPETSTLTQKAKPVIGLMGGPGSGKSTVAKMFAELGCAIIDADRLAHEALRTVSVRQAVRERWGESVFDEDGAIVRSELGRIVFSDPTALRELEALVHPLVHQGRQYEREQHQADTKVVAIVEDCPLLLESELDKQCDALVLIDVPSEVRLARVRETRGWDEAELNKRDEQQLPLDIKRQAADYVISNEQDLAHVRKQVMGVLKSITHTTP